MTRAADKVEEGCIILEVANVEKQLYGDCTGELTKLVEARFVA
jgi:hypothetical protein